MSKKFWKLFVTTFVISVAVSLTALFFIERQRYIREIDDSISQDAVNLSIVKNVIETKLSESLSDILFVRDLFEIKEDILNSKEEADSLSYEFQAFSRQAGVYDQVRYLDMSGQERIRINYNQHNPMVVSEDKLQNKKGRYYFDEALEINRDQIYVSPLDLNIENGEIESPGDDYREQIKEDSNIWRKYGDDYVKPMIRFATPTADKDKNINGVVLLNFFGQELIGKVDAIEKQFSQEIMLLNREGYWIKSPQEHREWGFMHEDSKDEIFNKYFPNEWEKISSENSGSLVTDNGIFVFETVTLPEIENISFKIISHTKEGDLDAISNNYFKRNIATSFFIIILFSILSFLYAVAVAKRKNAEMKIIKNIKSLESQNIELKEVKIKLEKSLIENRQKREEAEKMNETITNRELKMIELKEEIARLKKEKSNK